MAMSLLLLYTVNINFGLGKFSDPQRAKFIKLHQHKMSAGEFWSVRSFGVTLSGWKCCDMKSSIEFCSWRLTLLKRDLSLYRKIRTWKKCLKTEGCFYIWQFRFYLIQWYWEGGNWCDVKRLKQNHVPHCVWSKSYFYQKGEKKTGGGRKEKRTSY